MKTIIFISLKLAGGIAVISVVAGIVAFIKERIDKKKECAAGQSADKGVQKHTAGVYEKYVKRPLDCALATGALLVLSPVLLVIAVLVRIKLGSPVIFTQERPGKDEKIFKLYKFRSMTDERDEKGELLPDEVRLTEFGKKLRSTSLDELPELVNIIKGDMAVVGPRPQLVRDMVFMTDELRKRHGVRPGLTGLAQVNGRNSIAWEEKLEWDLKYLKDISLLEDIRIVFYTFKKAFWSREGVNRGGTVSDIDYGDWLLQGGRINRIQYDEKQEMARNILK